MKLWDMSISIFSYTLRWTRNLRSPWMNAWNQHLWWNRTSFCRHHLSPFFWHFSRWQIKKPKKAQKYLKSFGKITKICKIVWKIVKYVAFAKNCRKCEKIFLCASHKNPVSIYNKLRCHLGKGNGFRPSTLTVITIEVEDDAEHVTLKSDSWYFIYSTRRL